LLQDVLPGFCEELPEAGDLQPWRRLTDGSVNR